MSAISWKVGDSPDYGVAKFPLLEGISYVVEDDPEIQETVPRYPITGNTVPACFGISRPGSIPATSRRAASV